MLAFCSAVSLNLGRGAEALPEADTSRRVARLRPRYTTLLRGPVKTDVDTRDVLERMETGRDKGCLSLVLLYDCTLLLIIYHMLFNII